MYSIQNRIFFLKTANSLESIKTVCQYRISCQERLDRFFNLLLKDQPQKTHQCTITHQQFSVLSSDENYTYHKWKIITVAVCYLGWNREILIMANNTFLNYMKHIRKFTSIHEYMTSSKVQNYWSHSEFLAPWYQTSLHYRINVYFVIFYIVLMYHMFLMGWSVTIYKNN